MTHKTKARILVDENVPQAEAYFGRLGQVERFSGRDLSAAEVRSARALVVRSVTRVDQSLLAGSCVEFVGTCTIGTDHLDTAWLAEQGIAYANAPGCNANSVVEYVLTALAVLDCNWQSKRVGIVGCGNVGGALYRRLSALGAQVVGYDPLLAANALPQLVSLASVFDSQIVCLHAPLTREGSHPTWHMITEALLARLPQDAVLINAGRGAVIDNEMLLQFCRKRPDVQLVQDVWEFEPWLEPALLAAAKLGTPHIAGYSYDGKVTGTEMIYAALCRQWRAPSALAEAAVEGVAVNADSAGSFAMPLSEADWQQVRHVITQAYDLVGDDQRLRAMVAQAPDRAALERGFDALRKHYPERREFRFCLVPSALVNGGLSPAARAMLTALGFSLTGKGGAQ